MRSSPLAALTAAVALAGPALASLPPPSDAAKAKAAEAAEKAAWSKKVDAHKVCEIENRLAKAYHANFNDAPPPLPTSECVDPGPTPVESKPLEAAGAHSPPGAATSPPSTNATSAELTGSPKK
ncbi:MAG TPA: hypothetical protein VFG60_07260 [Burkholderiaceae bacterium]|nr:hypothetical protein [Burkholderiaceae bacterium]